MRGSDQRKRERESEMANLVKAVDTKPHNPSLFPKTHVVAAKNYVQQVVLRLPHLRAWSNDEKDIRKCHNRSVKNEPNSGFQPPRYTEDSHLKTGGIFFVFV
ncbi:hypothetical protein STEG23_033683 [Scotinomys teguina]